MKTFPWLSYSWDYKAGKKSQGGFPADISVSHNADWIINEYLNQICLETHQDEALKLP